MLGQLQRRRQQFTTLAHYLELLAGAGMLTGIPKFAGQRGASARPSPKFQVLNKRPDGRPKRAFRSGRRRKTATCGTADGIGDRRAFVEQRDRVPVEVFYWPSERRSMEWILSCVWENPLSPSRLKAGEAGKDCPVSRGVWRKPSVQNAHYWLAGKGAPEEFLQKSAAHWLSKEKAGPACAGPRSSCCCSAWRYGSGTISSATMLMILMSGSDRRRTGGDLVRIAHRRR